MHDRLCHGRVRRGMTHIRLYPQFSCGSITISRSLRAASLQSYTSETIVSLRFLFGPSDLSRLSHVVHRCPHFLWGIIARDTRVTIKHRQGKHCVDREPGDQLRVFLTLVLACLNDDVTHHQILALEVVPFKGDRSWPTRQHGGKGGP